MYWVPTIFQASWDRHGHPYTSGGTDLKDKINDWSFSPFKINVLKESTQWEHIAERPELMCRMKEAFSGQGIFKIRPERGVKDMGDVKGGWIFLDKEASMSEDPWQENVGMLERLKLKAGQCG